MGGESSKQWILLAAGSKGWDNYRHQADVCHAYQMARSNGIPDEQIIVMMYDDIAYNKENPFKGNIINEPNGSNVYEGVLKDYTGNDVSAENFLAVLEGDESSVTKRGPKKVIKSGSNDTIFVYLSDHGSNGIFAFPKSTLYATDLIDTVKRMNSNQQFSQMVMYVESCHSGSMLSQLPRNINVYGVSASKPDENSYACCYDQRRNAYLADVFTAHWLHHNKMVDLEETTFQDQFAYLRRNVGSSTPCQYGNQEMRRGKISQFWGNSPAGRGRNTLGRVQALNLTDAIPSYNVPLKIQENRIQNEHNAQKREEHRRRYAHLQQTRRHIETAMTEIAHRSCPTRGPACLTQRQCTTRLRDVKIVSEHFRTCCFDWHEEQFEYALSQTYVFVNLCESGVDVARIQRAITHVSHTHPRS